MKHLLGVLLLFWVSQLAQAGQTLVLIHGYLGTGSAWRTAGIINQLQHDGWQDSGHLFPEIIHNYNAQDTRDMERQLYTLTLPSEAPLPLQTRQLEFYLHWLQQQHPDNQIILVGHSAGGVVARLCMIVNPTLPVVGLITIASPHLGTDKAELAYLLSHSPASWFAPFMGLDTLNRSEELYWDLIRERPSTALFWLNRQPHPRARYISIVRVNEGKGFDDLVPNYSQDMNNVSALRGKSLTIPTRGSHGLRWSDGEILVILLNRYFPD